MYKICVFAGTAEGRELVTFLTAQQNVRVMACVATEYGEMLLEPAENLTVSAQRLQEEEMVALFERERFTLVVDSTHPYAPIVTENIAAACKATDTEYLRLLRENVDAPEDAVFAANVDEAVDYLNTEEGNILLTTGSKELARYTAIRDFDQRVYARVLPMEESLRLCQISGLPPSHILAMQGPFSKEMNVAMLRAVSARFMVTKESGTKGGFDEKISAAREANAKLVVIGRPPQRQGIGFEETVSRLCRRFGWVPRPQVSIVGIGPGSRRTMTVEALETIEKADCIIGARRMLDAVAEGDKPTFEAVASEEIVSIIRHHAQYRCFAVVVSGDVGFFSGAKKLLPLLSWCDVTLLPGLNSLVYLCARLGESYETVVPVSLHGRKGNIAESVRRHEKVFVLVGGENGAGVLCRKLCEAGLSGVRVSVGEHLSYADERITTGTAKELANRKFHSLSAVLIVNSAPQSTAVFGLPDEKFRRSETVPMTKSEVRAVCLSKLHLNSDSICWDVGAGTGSISVEMALQLSQGQVYAIEKREDAVKILRENAEQFGLENIHMIQGTAPEACRDLPAPTHVFIGGSSGKLHELLALAIAKNPCVRIVATAITLETIAELTNAVKQFNFTDTEVVSLSVSKDRKAGPYHLMMGQNPVYIFTMGERQA